MFRPKEKCPFCAYDHSRIETLDAGDHAEYAVMCANCGAFGPNDLGKSGAVEAWNMRRQEYPGPNDAGFSGPWIGPDPEIYPTVNEADIGGQGNNNCDCGKEIPKGAICCHDCLPF